jgi:signal transduction histidine kinase
MAEQLGIPEVVAYHLLPVIEKVNVVLMISLPVVSLILFSMGFIITRNLVGPINRLERELKEIVAGQVPKKIQLRKRDELKPLVDNINILLNRIEERHS